MTEERKTTDRQVLARNDPGKMRQQKQGTLVSHADKSNPVWIARVVSWETNRQQRKVEHKRESRDYEGTVYERKVMENSASR